MKKLLIPPVLLSALLAGGAVRIVQDQCGPFTDVTPSFCPYILELYYLGITVGTSATTFSPDDPLTRGQAAVFISKGLNQSLARSSRRSALGQWWTANVGPPNGLGVTTVGSSPIGVACDGADVWVANGGDSTVSRVRASDGRLLGTWTGASQAWAVLVAMGKVFVSSAPGFQPVHGKLYMIDPTQPPGPVTTVVPDLGMSLDPVSLAFDGSRIWANSGFPGTPGVAIITPAATPPWPVTAVTGSAFGGFGLGMVYDGSNIWVTGGSGGSFLKLDSSGNVLQTVPMASGGYPAFDGTNIWMPSSNGVLVIQASSGAVIATLTGNGIAPSLTAAFDGQRILVTNEGNGVSLWKAADLMPLGSFPMPANSTPYGACSDGINFWIALAASNQIARF